MSSKEGSEERAGRLVGPNVTLRKELLDRMLPTRLMLFPRSSKEMSGVEGSNQRDRHLAKGNP